METSQPQCLGRYLPESPCERIQLCLLLRELGSALSCTGHEWHDSLCYPARSTDAVQFVGGAGDYETGTYRDIQRFIDEAKKAGLWLIVR